MQIYIIARLTAEKEFSKEFLETLKQAERLSQEEKGCDMYQVTSDLKDKKNN